MIKTITIFPLLFTSVSAFITPSCTGTRSIAFHTPIQTSPGSSSLKMAGFGGGGDSKTGSKKKKKAKESSTPKLKPKSQWDKYLNLKKDSGIKVAVRVAANNDSDAGEWYEVGMIKSEGDKFTELAVVMQRAIIAEHAKRLHPLQFLPKSKVEWGYASNENWVAVDKKAANDAPSNIEKKIGFEGNPDGSGFYSSVTGNQFVGDASNVAASANGSGTLDRSVLPRVK